MKSVDFLAMCTCIYSTSRERKRLFGCCFNPRPGFRVGKISQCACAFLDESLAWVLRKSLFYECTTSACNSPLAFAIVRRSAWSIPMFRADFLPFTSQIVEHSRYLPLLSVASGSISVLHGLSSILSALCQKDVLKVSRKSRDVVDSFPRIRPSFHTRF
jgi:hypothetical protein